MDALLLIINFVAMSIKHPKYKCVIFDCDGVLVDSEAIGNQVLVELANGLGASIDLDYALTHFKGGSMNSGMEKISKLISAPMPSDFEAQYRALSFKRFKSNIQPIKGILEIVKQLKVPFCVASSGPVSKIRLNLEYTELLPYFEGRIFSCYDINKWKPDPAIYLLAAKTMGFKPSDCVVIEDSVIGATAAKAGGFTVFGYGEHDTENELSAIADVVFSNMKDLEDLL